MPCTSTHKMIYGTIRNKRDRCDRLAHWFYENSFGASVLDDCFQKQKTKKKQNEEHILNCTKRLQIFRVHRLKKRGVVEKERAKKIKKRATQTLNSIHITAQECTDNSKVVIIYGFLNHLYWQSRSQIDFFFVFGYCFVFGHWAADRAAGNATTKRQIEKQQRNNTERT